MSWHKIADIFTWLRRKFTLGHFASTPAPSAISFHSCHCHLIGDCLPFFRLDENGQVLFSNLAATKLLKQAHSQTEITQALKARASLTQDAEIEWLLWYISLFAKPVGDWGA